MNKDKIKNFSVNARRKLLESMKRKAFELGISENGSIIPPQAETNDSIIINGKVFNKDVKKQRVKLIQKIEESGFAQVIDEVAYTWFNRFIALRFMEINHYLDHDLNIISSLNPTALASKAGTHFSLDKQEIAKLVFDNKDEELYKRLIIAQCNALHNSMPFLFKMIKDETELLFPVGLLQKDSVIREMMETIQEEDWKEVEIIGWMYQYYISEKKDEVVGLHKGVIAREDIPAATQLFTPDWIVRYMVENSLGRLWFEMYPDTKLIENWEFFIKPNEEDFEKRSIQSIEEIKFFDPCCGSGHILVYAFDLFHQMYVNLGYSNDEIPELILKNNLYGLDICRRAVQLANFSLMMKAKKYGNKGNGIDTNLFEIVDSKRIPDDSLAIVARDDKEKREIRELIEAFTDAKNTGSLTIAPAIDYDKFIGRVKDADLSSAIPAFILNESLKHVLIQSSLLHRKYEVVCTNPPYLNNYDDPLKDFINKHYKDYKSDLFSAFIYRCNEMVKPEGFCGMMSPMTWLFIKTHELLRNYLIRTKNICSLVHPEYHSFYSSAHVPIMTFVSKNSGKDKRGIFIDLNHIRGEDLQPIMLKEAIRNPDVDYRHTARTSDFKSIPGNPIAYWASDRIREIFKEAKPLEEYSKPRQGLATTDNSRFLRRWFEVELNDIGFNYHDRLEAQDSGLRWFPYNKGGEFRKWCGNIIYVVNYFNDGYEIKKIVKEKYRDTSYAKSFSDERWDKLIELWVVKNQDFYFKPSLTWSFISASTFSIRFSPPGAIFDVIGSSIFPNEDKIFYFAGFLCSKLSFDFLKILNPTMAFQVGNIASLPVLFPDSEETKKQVDNLVEQNISISKTDWDSFETSWDFERHPFITHNDCTGRIEDAYNKWEKFAEEQFYKLKANEEELNRIFIGIYGLGDEMTPEVEEKDVTINKADKERDVKSFLSYAVGCMMGRYSPDEPGLAYAGGEFDLDKYKTFPADDDAIIPILEEKWFDDDIVSRFYEFLRITFGDENFPENAEFIAQALGKTDRETPDERIRKYFLRNFYKNHCQTYKKRPIYWLFTSGKNQSFNALVYLHRYDKYTLARLRKDYLHELQSRLDRKIEFMEDKGDEKKKLSKLYKQQEELRKYDEKLKHYADMRIEVDLDDGVAVNYEKFGKLVAEIK